jgi:hypothetical protein
LVGWRAERPRGDRGSDHPAVKSVVANVWSRQVAKNAKAGPIDNEQALEVAIDDFRQKARVVLSRMRHDDYYGSLKLEVYGHGRELTGFDSNVLDKKKFA